MSDKKSVGKEITLPDGSIAPLSAAYRENGFLFTSGQLAFDETGKLHTGDIVEQTCLCLENIQRLLVLEGLSLQDVVKVVDLHLKLTQWGCNSTEAFASDTGIIVCEPSSRVPRECMFAAK